MRLHDAAGDRARALRVYHACTGTLERELGVGPSAETRDLHEALIPGAAEAAAPANERAAALVGRSAERTRLTELWREAESGRAQLVLVTGEPGIGKTRLVEELRSWCAHRGAATALARSYAAEGALAYGPVVDWLRAAPLAAALERLDDRRRTELSRLLPELGREPGEPRPAASTGERQQLFEALAGALLATADRLLLVADDLQWADDETLQFLHYLIRSAPDARLLVLATARREDIVEPHRVNPLIGGLQALGRVVELELARLSHQQTAVLAEALTGSRLGEREAERLFAQTEGNPLFVVETLRADRMSRRIQAVLESRLAQLSDGARELAGVAATIGREFRSDVLVAASGADIEDAVRALDELWRRRIIREQGPESYDFSHDKLREVAYARLSPAVQRHHHLRIARALERAGAVGAQVATHYDSAGAPREAVPWYARAADDAQRVYASADAIKLLDRGHELLRELPPGGDRDRQELELTLALLAPLLVVEGAAATRLTEVQRRALELAPVPPAPLLRSVAVTSLAQGRFDDARRAGGELCERGDDDDDPVRIVEGHYVLGICAFWRGELQAAREHFGAAVERARPEQRATHLAHYGLDPTVVCLSRLANTLWFLGETDAAIRARGDALAMAEDVGHPATTGTALVFAAWLSLELDDERGIREYTAALTAPAPEEATKAPAVAGDALGGYVEVLDGRHAAGVARIRGALRDTRAGAYAPGQQASIVRLLLAAHAVAHDATAGLHVADEELASGSPVRLWEAEVRRLRARFLARLGGQPSEIDAELRRALQVATQQGALALAARVRGTLAERGERDRAAT
jgi:tetratricopeptide (TPR) repeat protein